MCNDQNRHARSARRLLTLALLSAAAIVPATAGAHGAAPVSAPSTTSLLVFSSDAYDNEMGVRSPGRRADIEPSSLEFPNVAFMDYIDDV